MKSSERALEVLPEPNKQYAKDFENYLQVLNRNPKTIGSRMLELAWLLKHLGKDAKRVTKTVYLLLIYSLCLAFRSHRYILV